MQTQTDSQVDTVSYGAEVPVYGYDVRVDAYRHNMADDGMVSILASRRDTGERISLHLSPQEAKVLKARLTDAILAVQVD